MESDILSSKMIIIKQTVDSPLWDLHPFYCRDNFSKVCLVCRTLNFEYPSVILFYFYSAIVQTFP